MTNLIVVGVDPGLDGYACGLSGTTDGKNLSDPIFWPAPTTSNRGKRQISIEALAEQVGTWESHLNVYRVFMELINPLPKKFKGGKANYQRGATRWAWKVALYYTSFKPVEVAPKKWKRAMGIPMGEEADRDEQKRLAIELAVKLSPQTDFRAIERKKKPRILSPDKAEAFLIAYYGLTSLSQTG